LSLEPSPPLTPASSPPLPLLPLSTLFAPQVHTAPGHGQEDYLVGQRYGLELLSPVDDAGNFTEEAGQFQGLNVQVRDGIHTTEISM
jgi:hypothetical protein